uniref:Uncharacterized protein n=1 Tax=Romanomermis culicivorax TaxID=13658 RepID=A0A915KZ87_ROMCU
MSTPSESFTQGCYCKIFQSKIGWVVPKWKTSAGARYHEYFCNVSLFGGETLARLRDDDTEGLVFSLLMVDIATHFVSLGLPEVFEHAGCLALGLILDTTVLPRGVFTELTELFELDIEQRAILVAVAITGFGFFTLKMFS